MFHLELFLCIQVVLQKNKKMIILRVRISHASTDLSLPGPCHMIWALVSSSLPMCNPCTKFFFSPAKLACAINTKQAERHRAAAIHPPLTWPQITCRNAAQSSVCLQYSSRVAEVHRDGVEIHCCWAQVLISFLNAATISIWQKIGKRQICQ